ncbi:MAG: hypothetical protein RAP03_09965, partial [Candidatus Electryonea clarkiae]|nr:hypothetical protein [Candidatus Electryonea clarkiae]
GKTTNEEENRFIRYCYIVFFDTNKEKSWKVYDQLKLRFNANLKDETYVIECIETIENFLEFVSDASLHYAYFHSNNYFCVSYKGQYKKNFQEILKLLRCQHTNASILPLYLAIMSRLTSSDNILKIINLLVLLEKVNFRIYILPKVTSRADSKQGDMFWFAKEFFDYPDWRDKFTTAYNDVKLEGDIFDWLEANLIQITKYYCPELKFIQSLTIDSDEAEDYYQWNGMRYFLANYEKQLQSFHKHDWGIEYILQSRKEAENNDYLSREHIWAQNHRISDFKAKYIEKRRLGNFVLLGLASNIKLSDNEISAKIIELNNYNSKNIGPLNLVQVHELQEFYSSAHKYVIKKRKSNVQSKYYFSDLSRRINDERETKLIRFALDRWKLPGESLTKFIKVDSFLKEQDNEKYIIKESLESKQ